MTLKNYKRVFGQHEMLIQRTQVVKCKRFTALLNKSTFDVLNLQFPEKLKL